MKKILFALAILIQQTHAQEIKNYRYDTDLLNKEFHKGRREALREKMPNNSVAVLFASPERNRSKDDDYQYHQDPNFYYLTGFTEPNSMFLVFKSPQTLFGITTDEFLFVPARDADAEMWNGRRAGVAGAKQVTGISGVLLTSQFDSATIAFEKFDKVLYSIPKGAVDDQGQTDDLYDLIDAFKKKCSYPPANGDARLLSSRLAELRAVKLPEEIVLMKKATAISCMGHAEIMRTIKPGMHEYDAQAVGEYVFKRNGAEDVGYLSICGGGENSCILHYESNRRQLVAGDLLLNDMAAEYHGYSADVTRTIPVSGKFSPEQKIIYELVIQAQEAAFAACKPGNAYSTPHKAAIDVIKKGLTDLGILKNENDYRRYFMHSTSHYLGLDTHDAADYSNLKTGNIITVEPGIYIPDGSPCDPKWWNIGVRVEDDVLVTETDHEILTAAAPRTVEAIEKMMKEKPLMLK